MIIFVWAEDEKHQIGLDGHLPWYLPKDLEHFKKLTVGHPIIMGRKTFASLPRLLPNRQHIVLSSSCEVAHKFDHNNQVVILSSLNKLKHWLKSHQDEKIFVIGGTSVFQALKKQVDYLEKTEIKAVFAGDTIMPTIDYSQFELIKKETHLPDDQNKYSYEFLTYARKEKRNEEDDHKRNRFSDQYPDSC